ncbi:hypothetical protein MYCTH_2114542 [Thermothelomyces thermophilus ATCC 42464]|uniref:Uncharacterized protein n=2 Tax=Thermothelomyces thermophilus TaxID=78579 RepID=G2Q419_THET4|nr:uncharacterized protein MYCTH_2114542 [Thermothelomyces thermophilus ATCC 42464]AEO53618.1 hypothetical protein MYCTH_2114542 [Thermothelomyces thermophilus ATCC 42464]AKA20435.1 glycosyl hydrolase [Thermothelomyces thermophilus]
MRLQALTLSLLAAAGLASPIRSAASEELYTLRLSSADKSLDGRYLTTIPDSGNANTTALVVYTSSSKPGDAFIKFHPVVNPSTKLAELRTPSSSSNVALAVVGTNGLFDFASVADPDDTADDLPEGTKVDWTSFRLHQEGDIGTVEYEGDDDAVAEGNWFAFPIRVSEATKEGEAWGVKWKDGSAWTTTDYLPVKVVYEPAYVIAKDE